MDPTVILLVLAALVLLAGERIQNHLEVKGPSSPKKYDPHYTRRLEKENREGGAVTVCGNEKCKECYPGPIELPRLINYCMSPTCSNATSSEFCQRCRMRGVDKKTSSSFGSRSLINCSTCRVPLDDDGWCTNGCVKKALVSVPPARYREVDCTCMDVMTDTEMVTTLICSPCKERGINKMLGKDPYTEPLQFRKPEFDYSGEKRKRKFRGCP